MSHTIIFDEARDVLDFQLQHPSLCVVAKYFPAGTLIEAHWLVTFWQDVIA